MNNTIDIMQQLKQEQNLRNYSGRIREAAEALQQAIQAINQIIGDITNEETFVEQIHNQMTVDVFMTTTLSTINTVLQGCAAHLNFTCPTELELLATKQKALQDIYHSITAIQELLARHSYLYGICNYQENYRIYQLLHAFFKRIENDCLTLATYVTEADVIAWLETCPAAHRQFITALQEIWQHFIDKYARDVTHSVSTTMAMPLTIDKNQVPVSESTAAESENILTENTLSATTGIAELSSTADPALNTGFEFLTTLPKELFFTIANSLDAKSLCALASTGKTQAKRLLPLIENELKNSALYLAANSSLLYTSHQLLGCGWNHSGQLGLGDAEFINQFTPIPGLMGQIRQVIARGERTLVLTSEGLFGYGKNNSGQLGLGDTDRVTQFTPIPGLTGQIRQVIAEYKHTFALTTEGLFGCGENHYGRLGLGDTDRVTQFTPIPGLTGQILQVIAVDLRTLVLTTEGLFGCGKNNYGQLGLGDTKFINQFTPIPGLTGQILQVIAEDWDYHTLVLTTEGLFGCGENNYGRLGLGDTKFITQFTPIPGLTGQILQVIAADLRTLVLTTEGLFGCGKNDSGQLGLGDAVFIRQFTQLTKLPGQILQVIAGNAHTLVLTTEGLFGCGDNTHGQLGFPKNEQAICCFTHIQDKNIKALLSLQRKLQLLQTIVKDAAPQTYLLPANSDEPIQSQKQAALAQLQIVLAGIISLPTLYDLFIQVTQAKTSVLRLHRKNRLATHGDTDSYRSAIKALANKALTFQSACSSFAQYTLLQTMLQEALRCNAPGQHWKRLLLELQAAALRQLLQDIQQATDLNQLLTLFQALIEPKNLLRFNPSAIFHAYGDTDAYKTALLQLGQQMEKYTFTRQTLPQLYLLLEHLRIVKPSFNVEWQHTIEKLANKLRTFHKTIGVVQTKNLPSTRAAKP